MKVIGTLSDGQKVIDRPNSHYDKNLEEMLSDILGRVSVNSDRIYVEETFSLSEKIGVVKIFETRPDDQIFYAQRLSRRGLSRFVKNREPEMTDKVTVVLKKDKCKEHQYVLITAYFGERTGPEPYDDRATKGDLMFWNSHAFIDDYTEYLTGTYTEDVPKYFKIS